jgi:cytochrome c2
VALLVNGGGTPHAAGEVARGEVVFQKCYACHSVVPGETGLTGPNLFGVVGAAFRSGMRARSTFSSNHPMMWRRALA